jgi:hypothetical protein
LENEYLMDEHKPEEIEHTKKNVSSVGIFKKYGSGKDQASRPAPESLLEDKPRRKRKVVRLDQIVSFSPIQPGQRAFDISNPEDIELADSIKETGQHDPVTLLFLGLADDKYTYELVGGHRRFGAIRHNAGDQWQSAKIEAEILNPDEDKITVALHTNRGIMRLSPPQRAELYFMLHESQKLSVAQICKRYHLDEKEDYITRLIMAWDSPDPVRSLFSRGLAINRTLDLRGAWNRLPDDWRKSRSSQLAAISISGANLFIDRIRNGSSPDDALQEAKALSPSEELPAEEVVISPEGRGADLAIHAAHASFPSLKGKVVSIEDHTLLEPMFSALGLPSAKIADLKRAGGSDTFEEMTLAALALRRGLDLQNSLTGARALTHSKTFRHVAHRLVLDISKIATKTSDSPEYQFLKYILSLTDSRPSPQPTAPKGTAKKIKPASKKKASGK